MSTGLLYHAFAFGIRGYDDVRIDERGGQVIFTIAQDAADGRCSACGSRVPFHEGSPGRLRDPASIRDLLEGVCAAKRRGGPVGQYPRPELVFQGQPAERQGDPAESADDRLME